MGTPTPGTGSLPSLTAQEDDARPSADPLFGRLFRGTHEGLAIVVLGDGKILEANDAFLRLTGLDRAQAIGVSSFDLGLWADLGGEGSARAILAERTWVEDLLSHVVHPNGEVSTLRLSAEMLAQGEEEQPLILVRATEASSLVGSDRFRVLREAEARYRALVEQLPAIVYTEAPDEKSPTGFRDVYISPQTVDKLGYTAQEWQNDPTLWQRCTHPEDLPGLLAEEERTAETGETFSFTYRMIARDGGIVWFHDDAVCVRDPQTDRDVWKGIMLDITEQKIAEEHLREAEARYRTLIEQMPAIVYRSENTPAGDWLYVSPQIERILGFTAEEWLLHPHPFASFCHPEDLARIRDAEEQAFSTGESFRNEYRMRTNDGRWRWILDEAEVVHDANGNPAHLQGLMFDITERKAAEERIRKALERERAANQRLAELDALKNTLLHTVSHDLRTPLTAIHAAAGTLMDLNDRLTDAERNDLFVTLLTRSDRMEELLSDLLDLDRLDRGVVEPRRDLVDLAELVPAVLAKCDGLDGRTIEVHIPPLEALLDRTKTERIVENLVTNAVHYTSRKVPIRVFAERALGGDDHHDAVLLTVEDEGPGVADEVKTEIFEPFRRGPAGEQGPTGTGIGLSLVSSFAQLHGGRAWVEDRPGGGARFCVLLPSGDGGAFG
ncbi:MAG: PAS domain-containing protein [Actinomycetota bacterium]